MTHDPLARLRALRHHPQHPVNVVHEASFGARVADRLVAVIGSWPSVLGHLGFIAGWIAYNAVAPTGFRFDAQTLIHLNLVLSCEAALAAAVILLASNRASARDRLTLEHAAAEADRADEQNEAILAAIKANTDATLQILERVKPNAAVPQMPATPPP